VFFVTGWQISAFADEAAGELPQQISALKRNRIAQIEIRNLSGKCVIDLSDRELSDTAQMLEENGVGVSAIGSPIGKISITEDFAPHFARFERAVAAAKRLGTRRIRMFSFYIPKGEEPKKYRDEVLRRLSALCAYAARNGVFCCHENEKGIYGDTAERALELHRELGDGLHGIFDPANYIQCGERPGEIFSSLLPYVDYLHIKDALLEDGSVVPAGKGDGALPEILSQFKREKGPGLLTVEPHLHVFEGLSSLQGEALLHKYSYKSADEAFDAACGALQELLAGV